MGGFAIGLSFTGVNLGGVEFSILAKSPFNMGASGVEMGLDAGPFIIVRGIGGGGGGGGTISAAGVCCFGGEFCFVTGGGGGGGRS